MSVHLRGHFNVTKVALKHWRGLTKASGQPVHGSLVHTSSESGLYGAPGQANYDAAKGGIAAFSIAIAREGRRYGITSNAICPRAYTRMTSANFDQAGDEEAAERLHPRLITPWVAFLLSDAAADITGQCFVVGGGLLRLVEYWPVVADTDMPDVGDLGGLQLAATQLFEGRSSHPTRFPRVVPGLG
jgi:NAD(P)-dependent dehydrogenase (short-subunit alcohol dehydrogenase family)